MGISDDAYAEFLKSHQLVNGFKDFYTCDGGASRQFQAEDIPPKSAI
jgi:hypothetical protein